MSIQFSIKHLVNEGIPNKNIEEWKFFDTSLFSQNNWMIPNSEPNLSDEKKVKNNDIKITFKNGVFKSNLSNVSNKKDQVEIHSLKKYIINNPDILSKVYTDPKPFAENRISNSNDTRALSLVTLNALLKNDGVVIIIKKNANLPEFIEISHINDEEKNHLIINPYLLLVSEENSSAKILEVFYGSKENIWTNLVTQLYLEKNSTLDISRIQFNKNNGIRTSSLLCNLESYSKLSCFNFNEGNIRDDIRVNMMGNSSKCQINGIITAGKSISSDTYCKVTHSGKECSSNQNWRLISTDMGKSSVQGKIRVDKGASKSEGHFNSKTLLLGEKAKVEVKPELEILEDDIICSHGASIGELDKDALFYLQSRGIQLEEARKIILYAFIEQTLGKTKKIKDLVYLGFDNFFQETI